MGQFVINGGRTLGGEICVGGSKNAALPIIFSAILIKGKSIIKNLPDIIDVTIALKILEILGATVERLDSGVVIDTENLSYAEIPKELTSKIRASTYLLGAMLGRFGKCKIEE